MARLNSSTSTSACPLHHHRCRRRWPGRRRRRHQHHHHHHRQCCRHRRRLPFLVYRPDRTGYYNRLDMKSMEASMQWQAVLQQQRGQPRSPPCPPSKTVNALRGPRPALRHALHQVSLSPLTASNATTQDRPFVAEGAAAIALPVSRVCTVRARLVWGLVLVPVMWAMARTTTRARTRGRKKTRRRCKVIVPMHSLVNRSETPLHLDLSAQRVLRPFCLGWVHFAYFARLPPCVHARCAFWGPKKERARGLCVARAPLPVPVSIHTPTPTAAA